MQNAEKAWAEILEAVGDERPELIQVLEGLAGKVQMLPEVDRRFLADHVTLLLGQVRSAIRWEVARCLG